eukprot:Lithocolla_globosa_v1_NODE_1315_length_2677_cov_13.200229.p1 type:complete len:313 gc:universal NODE_1315_length_2677_cov_13.200229:1731-2669(+)
MFTKKREQTTEQQILRKKQIDSLKKLNPSVKEVERDVLFELVVAGPPVVSLNVFLATNFPDVAPQMSVRPAIEHPWVDSEMNVVGHSRVSSWNAHSSLGKLVKEVAKELKTNPPKFLPAASPLPTPSTSYKQRSLPTPTPTPTPQIQEIMPEVLAKSNAELEALLSNENLMENFVTSLPAFSSLKTVPAEMEQQNKQLAEQLLRMEPNVKNLQEEMASKQAVYDVQKQKLDDIFRQLEQTKLKYSPEQLTKILHDAKESKDTETDELVDQLCDGTITQKQFIDRVMPTRTLFHSRAAMLEKFQAESHDLFKT